MITTYATKVGVHYRGIQALEIEQAILSAL